MMPNKTYELRNLYFQQSHSYAAPRIDANYPRVLSWPANGDFDRLKPDAELLQDALIPIINETTNISQQIFGNEITQQHTSIQHLANLFYERSKLHKKHIDEIQHRDLEIQGMLYGVVINRNQDRAKRMSSLETQLLQLKTPSEKKNLLSGKILPSYERNYLSLPARTEVQNKGILFSPVWRVSMADRDNSAAVRELCLKLKPILGPTMDQVFAAYCAEDAEGKQQIQRYLELAVAKHVPQKLEQSDAYLIPPTKEQAEGQYPIGMVQYAGKNLYEFGLREDEWIQHVAVLGRSGAGKTNVGFVLLRELRNKGKPFLVFDWKRNYRDLISNPEFKDVEVYTIGRNITPFAFNPLIPPEGTSPKTWLKKLNEIIAHSYCLGNGVLYLLQQAVDAVYEEAGVYDGTVQNFPTYKDVLLKARNMDVRGRESGWLSSTLRALSSLCFGEMDTLLNTSSNQSLEHLLDKSVIFELDALTQSDKVFFAEAVLLWLHHKRMTENRRETFRHCVLIEEAHHLLSDERRSLVGGQSVMEIIFREIREFGESLILLDQHPSKISLPALGNTYCTICMNLKHKTDITAMAQCLLLDKEKDLLGSLEVGEAIVKLQGRIARPFTIKVPEFSIQKGMITDAAIREHMHNSTVSHDEVAEHTLPNPADHTPINNNSAILNNMAKFLQDIRDNPESGIAARYQRLGLSVRQGQKLKSQAIRQVLIEEHMHTTKVGRLTFLQLSQKALQLLSSSSGP